MPGVFLRVKKIIVSTLLALHPITITLKPGADPQLLLGGGRQPSAGGAY